MPRRDGAFTPLELGCIDRFMVLRDQTAAYVAARGGERPRQATRNAAQIFARPHVRAEIARREEALRRVSDVEAAELIRMWSVEARATLLDFLSWDGRSLTLKPSAEIPPELAYALESIEQIPGKYGNTLKIKLCDRGRAKESLAKYLGLFKADNEQKASNVLALIHASLNLKALSMDELRMFAELLRKVQPLPAGEGEGA